MMYCVCVGLTLISKVIFCCMVCELHFWIFCFFSDMMLYVLGSWEVQKTSGNGGQLSYCVANLGDWLLMQLLK